MEVLEVFLCVQPGESSLGEASGAKEMEEMASPRVLREGRQDQQQDA